MKTAEEYLDERTFSNETSFSDTGESRLTSELMKEYAQQESDRKVREFKNEMTKMIADFQWYDWRDGDALYAIKEKLK